jgi:outer membrane lipoprotein-sorting protein
MRWMTLTVLVLLVGPAYGQENDAEKLYRAMEKKIRSAKSMHFAFDGQFSGEGMKGTMKGEVRMAEGEKAHMSMEGEFGGQNMKIMVISDGKSAYSKFNEQVSVKDTKPDEKHMEQGVALIARIGMIAAFQGIRQDSKDAFDIDKVAAIKDFKLGTKEKIGKHDTQAVEYHVTLPDGTPATARVWIDTTTKLPAKRELTGQRVGKDFQISETFTTFAVDEKIDPKMFELPK